MIKHTAILSMFLLAASLAFGHFNAPAFAVQSTAATTTDDPYQELYDAFIRLQKSLQALRAIGPAEHVPIEAFREQVREFSAKHPQDERALAMELVLSKWLGDQPAVNSLYARLIDLNPENRKLRLDWAQHEVSRNNYETALELLTAVEWAPETEGRAYLLIGDCHCAANRFEEALEAYRAIPEQGFARDPALRTDIDTRLNLFSDSPEKWREELAIRESDAAGEPLPQIELLTGKGRIVLELFENHAPNTTANMISLVEEGFYDTMRFHRVEAGNFAQVGDPRQRVDPEQRGTMDGPGYSIVDEQQREDARLHFAGSVSMASKGTNTGGSQFFITVTALPNLNSKHTVFGRVIEGLDVVRNLQKDDVMITARVLRKREHPYTVDKFPIPDTPTPIPTTVLPTDENSP